MALIVILYTKKTKKCYFTKNKILTLGLKWNVTSGIADPYMKFMTRWKYPSYQNSFSPNGRFKSLEFPDSNVVVDLPHFSASLSRYLDCYNYFFPLTVKLNPYLLEISKRAFMNKVLKGLLNEIGLD